MKKLTVNILSVLASFSLPSIAPAALLDFSPSNFSVTPNSSYDAINMSVGGINVNVTAYSIENDGLGTIFSRSQVTGVTVTGKNKGVYVSSSNNLGVKTASGDLNDMDGGGAGSTTDLDEGLLFTFNKQVHLNSIDFDLFSGSDDFNLTVDGKHLLWDFKGTTPNSLSQLVAGSHDEFEFTNIIGREFLIWADSDTDGFRIDDIDVTAVPLPTAFFTFGLGLSFLFFAQRKSVNTRYTQLR